MEDHPEKDLQMFVLKHAIIHSFTKEAHTDIIGKVVKKDIVLDTENRALIALAQGINGLIGTTGNSVVYGQFSNDERQGPFPAAFDAYTGNLPDATAFLSLSHLVMDQLVEQAAKRVLSTGGHILCALYESQGSQFFLVASMKQRGGIQLDENYVPKEIQEIDLNKVQQAARINVNDFAYITRQLAQEEAEIKDEAEAKEALEERIDTTYLCFVSRGRDSQASDYFIYALGCAKGVASGRATKGAIDAVVAFFQSKPALKGFSYKAKEAVIKYLEKQLEDKKSARLDGVCLAAVKNVPEDLAEHIEDIKYFLNDEKYKVPIEFSVNAKGLKEKTRIKSEAASWSIQFERGALGKEEVADVFYDEESKKLILTNLPDSLIFLIEEEIASRDK